MTPGLRTKYPHAAERQSPDATILCPANEKTLPKATRFHVPQRRPDIAKRGENACQSSASHTVASLDASLRGDGAGPYHRPFIRGCVSTNGPLRGFLRAGCESCVTLRAVSELSPHMREQRQGHLPAGCACLRREHSGILRLEAERGWGT